MRRLILALLLALAAPAAATPALAQTPPPAAAEAAPAYQAPAPTGLPQRAAPPRTLRAYWHLFGAFAIAWLLLFGYALSVGRRFAGLDADLQRLRR